MHFTFEATCLAMGRTAVEQAVLGNLPALPATPGRTYSSETILTDVFAEAGEVLSVNLITDRMTGRSRGFAFVEMAEASAARKAINELYGKTVGERQIKVAEARPQKPRGQRDSWGGGGRRRY